MRATQQLVRATRAQVGAELARLDEEILLRLRRDELEAFRWMYQRVAEAGAASIASMYLRCAW